MSAKRHNTLQETLTEILLDARDPGAIGFAVAQMKPKGSILWVQDRLSAMENGLPAPQALTRFNMASERLILACGQRAEEVLWAMEEGLRCQALGGIIGEIWGDPRALDFTATKRLALRAERQGVPVFLVRAGGAPSLSAARKRWRVCSRPSVPHPFDSKAPGAPRWRADLFRSRGSKPGTFEVDYDPTTHRLDLVPAFRHSALAPPQSTAGGRAFDRQGAHRARA
ncbi:MAG: hypothetical protein AAF590_07695 [Pseudomonadota bacterium]